MAYDGLLTYKMIEELNPLLTGRINKVTQPDQHTIILTVRANRKNQKLLLSIHPNYARMHVTQVALDNPFDPPMFLRVLRKHIDGGIIESITQSGNDRKVTLTVQNRDELGDPITRHLIIEMMGKHSNLILVDADNKIIDSIKHLTPNSNGARTLMPGFLYTAPPTKMKINPFTIDNLTPYLSSELPIKKAIVQELEGFSPVAASQLLLESNDLDVAFKKFMTKVKQQFNPNIFNVNNKQDFYFMTLENVYSESTYDTLSEMLDAYYKDRAKRDRVKNQSNDLVKHLEQLIQKNEKKLINLNQDLIETEQMDEKKLYGELITSNMYQLNQGMDALTTTNYYDNTTVTIPLDSRKSPADNAQQYYKQYNKLKARKRHATEQIKATKAEINYLDNVLVQMQHIDVDEIDEIKNELAEQNLLKKKHKKNTKIKRKPLDHYLSRDNQLILVGRNNLQNEQLTHKQARNNYIWLHTKDIPGSHVVIMDSNPTKTTLEDAAILASYYSKASGSTKVPVDYTLVKNVYKPNGSKPGFVTYVDQTTVIVDSDSKHVEMLKERYNKSTKEL